MRNGWPPGGPDGRDHAGHPPVGHDSAAREAHRELTKLYPAAWHLVATGEKWVRLRLTITAEISVGRPKPDRWDDRKPALHALVTAHDGNVLLVPLGRGR